ncbi:hypothetical protein SAMN02745121_03080 [Nannocystis exedens]|uniref:MYXO-CTERM domain-containing protein n=1 Tax=Nannocystis exedens TaxID=54 RepID=A0A1I1Y1C8_9BACT|nr:hypothetical protein [Nannocystis exedens]PCC71727.1 hypothetical protein NAEX_04806 [Nannocystis exedens]SFE12808.1 hypothetical protein SAMN02745121_03080 [Nannocystis exedens]
MRRRSEASWKSLAPPLALGVAALLVAPAPAGALTCWGPGWKHGGELVVTEDVPVDAHPWRLYSCGLEPDACILEAEGYSGFADPIRLGRNCRAGADEVGFGELVEYAPREPLVAGKTYTMSCSGGGEDETWSEFTVGHAAASPPGEVSLREVRIERGTDGGCCPGDVDNLLVRLDGLDAPYLREGGRIELRYPTGEVYPISVSDEAELRLPPTAGPLEFTPVAANGARGDAVRLEPEEIGEREAVYIPCAVGGSRPDLALWLLAPLLWIAGRRTRSA